MNDSKPGRAPTDPQGVTGRLADRLAHFRFEDVPPRVRERAKHILLDGIACAIVGAQLPWSRRAVRLVRSLEGTGDCIVIGWDFKTTAPAAALLNGTFIQGFELDDYHPPAPLHSTSLVVSAMLACLDRTSAITGAQAC